MRTCRQCEEPTKNRYAIYCSNRCQSDFQYTAYITSWKEGEVSGDKGIYAIGISNHLRRYLLEKFNKKCVECGWNKINLHTGKVPLEVDHIDGNATNNAESNLRILCPNCHSLTANFRNLNSGNGRKWRRDKYLKQ